MENADKKDGNQTNKKDNVSSIFRSMALVHEIAMDKNFKLNELPPDSIESQVKKVVHKAFWDTFEEDITKDPPDYGHVLKLLAELKETLLSLLVCNHNGSLKEQINNVLDLDLITQQSQQGSVDIQGYATYIIEVMSKICTPARDEDIAKLKKVEGLVPLLREIFRVLDLMQLDMANFQLSVFRPMLVQQSVQYEQEKFREYLNANPNGLLSTKQWIKRGKDALQSAQNEMNESSKEQPDTENRDAQSETSPGASGVQGSSGQSADLSEVVKHSYVGILLGEGRFPYPETLLMDRHRVAEMRWSVQCLVRVASILVVTLNVGGRHLASDSEYKKALKEAVYILLRGVPESKLQEVFPNICEQIVRETNTFLSKRGFETLDEGKLSLLRQQIGNLATDNHSVHQLMKKRVYGFVLGNLLRPKTSSPPLPAALVNVETELIQLTQQFAKLVSHNYVVFKPFYEQVIQELS